MADDKTRTGLAAAAGGGAAALIALALSKKVEAAPPVGEVTLNEAAMLLLQAIAESGDSIDDNTAATVDAIRALAAALGVVTLENPDQIVCFRVLVPVVNTPIQLPDYPIPYKIPLVIKALPANLGMIYVGNSRAEAMNINSTYWLIANEAIEYEIKGSGQLWINASRAGEGVVCTVEQRRQGGG